MRRRFCSARRVLAIYMVPGMVFQAIVVGGGYGTGRELVEFFLSQGPRNGLLSMLTATLLWSVVLALSFEVARHYGAYDYRTFLARILGPGWIVYELLYIVFVLLVLAVIGAAGGEILGRLLGTGTLPGILLIALAIAALLAVGPGAIEGILSAWAALLYLFFLALVLLCFARFAPEIRTALAAGDPAGSWLVSGVRYAAYNIGIVPAIMFCARHLETRREALVAGALAGVIGMAPALLIYLAMLSHYPAVLAAPIPIELVLAGLGLPVFALLFQIVLLGTFVDTGTGLLHALNERIAASRAGGRAQLGSIARFGTGAAVLAVTVLLASRTGVIPLIASGYGTLTWGFLIIFVLPVTFAGTRLLWRPRAASEPINASIGTSEGEM